MLYAGRDLLSETWEERMWGYTGLGGVLQAFGAGYFVWDVQVCAANIETLGVTDLLHAVVALSIAILGFVCRLPYAFDADIPPASIWLILQNTVRLGGAFHPVRQHSLVLNKLGRAGSTLQIVNRILLIVMFACAGLYGVLTLPSCFSAMYGRRYMRHSPLGRSITTRYPRSVSYLNTRRLGGLLSCLCLAMLLLSR